MYFKCLNFILSFLFSLNVNEEKCFFMEAIGIQVKVMRN